MAPLKPDAVSPLVACQFLFPVFFRSQYVPEHGS